jgi:hypothetical protein
MWQDYIGIIPGIAAAIMGGLTLQTKEMPIWKRRLLALLTVIAIGGTGISGWWTLHERQVQEAQQTQTGETLGKFIDEGQDLANAILASPTAPVQTAKITDWMQRSENFLQTLGTSYVVRFKSDAGLETSLKPNGDMGWQTLAQWHSVRMRVTRLHQFSAEFAGQGR